MKAGARWRVRALRWSYLDLMEGSKEVLTKTAVVVSVADVCLDSRPTSSSFYESLVTQIERLARDATPVRPEPREEQSQLRMYCRTRRVPKNTR